MNNEVFFHISGFICVMIFVIGLQFGSNNKLKKYMSAGALVAAFNMFLMQQYSGMIINIINFFRNILSLKINNVERYKHLFSFIFISSYVAVQYFINDLYWYLPILASTVGIVALFYLKGLYVRLCLFLGTSLWLLYAFLHGNMYGVILETLVLSSFIVSFIKNKMQYQN